MAKVKPADLAVDLGTSHTRIADRSGVVLTLPSVIAMRGRQALHVGEAAERLEGREPPGIEVVRPVRAGTVQDFGAAERLVAAALSQVARRGLRRPKVLLSIGAEASEVERRAAIQSIRAAGARDVAVIDRMVACAAGVGLPVTEPVGHLVIDLGAGGSRAAIVSLGAPVVQRAVPIGGDALDDAIRAWFRDERGVVIEPGTAANLKLHLVDLTGRTTRQIRIRGRDPVREAPREESVSTPDVVQALTGPIQRIRDVVRDVLRRASPELSADLLDRGAVLCGGGAALGGIDALLRADTELAVVRGDANELAVAHGCARILDDVELYTALVEGRI